MSNWLTYSPSSGYGDGTIRITADTYSELEERVATLVGYNTHYNLTASTTVTQVGSSSGEGQYLTFEIVSGGTIAWRRVNMNNRDIEYRLNDGEWTVFSSAITVNSGDLVELRGNHSSYSSTVDYYCTFGASTAYFNVYGNIMSLVYGDNFYGQTLLTDRRNFYNLFSQTNVISAENLVLPATALTDLCYSQMFYECTGLTTAPELPATTLAPYCYEYMFISCYALTTVPEILPATTLAGYCYLNMFADCSSLTTAPELPATTLANSCYKGMFWNCGSLKRAPELPAETLKSDCYTNMFRNCTSLNYIKCLATGAYNGLKLSGCCVNWVAGVLRGGVFVYMYGPSGRWDYASANGIPYGWTDIAYNPYEVGNVEFIFAATEDYGEFNIELTTTGVDNVVNVDGISETGTLATGFTSATTFSVGVQNLNSLGQGSRHIGISYDYLPSYNYAEVSPGNYTWQSGLQFEPGKKVYIDVF
jgi:hypothetical protein